MRVRFLSGFLLAAAIVSAPLVGVSSASAAGQGCQLWYSSTSPGPNGETNGSGYYQEGQRGPDGRICEDGWWYDSVSEEKCVNGGGQVRKPESTEWELIPQKPWCEGGKYDALFISFW